MLRRAQVRFFLRPPHLTSTRATAATASSTSTRSFTRRSARACASLCLCHILFVDDNRNARDAPFQLIHLRLFSTSRSRTMTATTFTICARAPGRDEETRDEPQRAARAATRAAARMTSSRTHDIKYLPLLHPLRAAQLRPAICRPSTRRSSPSTIAGARQSSTRGVAPSTLAALAGTARRRRSRLTKGPLHPSSFSRLWRRAAPLSPAQRRVRR